MPPPAHNWIPDSDPTIVEITGALVAAGIDSDAIDARPDGTVYVGSVAIGDQGNADDGPLWWAATDADDDRVVYEGGSLADMAAAVAEAAN